MSDHFKFDVQVTISDRWHMAFEDRGKDIKRKCAEAVEKVLEDNGFRKYREEYLVTV